MGGSKCRVFIVFNIFTVQIFTMVNSSDFIERLEHLLHYYDINASAFADKIQVQRSSISHLLSGRNKPSLEFVLKVVKNFPEVNLYWLLNGKGTFPSEDSGKDVLNQEDTPTPIHPPKDETNHHKKIIDRIVIFYSDGTFESHTPAT